MLDDSGGTNTTITLDGVSPTLAALTFSTSTGRSYDLAQGSGTASLILSNGTSAAAVVTVLSGTHMISAPITLSSSGSFAPLAGTQLVLSGNIGNGGASLPVALTNAGTLILSGTADSYSGGTYVDQGTLVANTNGSLPDNRGLVIGAGGTFVFDPTVTGAPAAALPQPAGAGAPVETVPEPSALVLLAVALWSAAIYQLNTAWKIADKLPHSKSLPARAGAYPARGRARWRTKPPATRPPSRPAWGRRQTCHWRR